VGQAHKSFPLRDIISIARLDSMSSKSYQQFENSKCKRQRLKLKLNNLIDNLGNSIP